MDHFEHDRDHYPAAFSKQLELPSEMKDYIKECILCNTDVHIENNDAEFRYEPAGQALEVGMMNFLIDNEDDVQYSFINRNKHQAKMTQLPFDQTLKRKTVIRQCRNQPDRVRVYTKGAPEFVIPLCAETFDNQMQLKPLTDENKGPLLDHVIGQTLASAGLKVLTYAFKEITRESLDTLMTTYHIESEEFRFEIEKDLIYMATFGLNDPLRDDIQSAVHMIRYGHKEVEAGKMENYQVNIRMITGDHIETARAVAIETGILSFEESQEEGVVITGEQFRDAIGVVSKIYDPETKEYKIEFVEGRKRFDEIKKTVKVIARSTSEDKFIFVCGIKQKGGLVGMTGDSISDAEALRKADVGFCMGSGCDVAKDNSDLVILDNDFVSIHRAIRWGRAIFDNVRKFLQFQLTMNFALCVITVVGGFTTGHAPLNVVQMLWANLIMDVLGAIAIGTEPYRTIESSCSNRISRKDQIIKPEMMRHIICHSSYQIFVLTILMFFGGMIFFTDSFNLVSTPMRGDDGEPTNRLILNTICFHTFILMNLFNAINSRVIAIDEMNVFKTLINNPFFWLVTIFEIFV